MEIPLLWKFYECFHFKHTHKVKLEQAGFCKMIVFQETADANTDKVERCGEPSPVEGRQHSEVPGWDKGFSFLMPLFCSSNAEPKSNNLDRNVFVCDQLKTTVKVVPRRRTRVRGRVSRPRTEAEQENIDIEKPVVPPSPHTDMIIRMIRRIKMSVFSVLSCHVYRWGSRKMRGMQSVWDRGWAKIFILRFRDWGFQRLRF